MNIYVGNLPYSMTSEQLEEVFAPHGTIVRAVVINDRETGRSKGFGFVEMADRDAGAAAIAALDGQEVDGRELRVNEARPREDR